MAFKTYNPGITRRARALGVGNAYLSLIVRGLRNNPEILARYEALVKAEAEAGPIRVHQKNVEAGIIAAERMLPLFRAASDARERLFVRRELAAKLTPDFWSSFDIARERLPIALVRRFQTALGPFIRDALDCKNVQQFEGAQP